MEMILELSMTLLDVDCCVADCYVMDYSFCGVDGDGNCGVNW